MVVLCLIGAMWGGTFPALKIAVTHIPPVGVAAGRHFDLRQHVAAQPLERVDADQQQHAHQPDRDARYAAEC